MHRNQSPQPNDPSRLSAKERAIIADMLPSNAEPERFIREALQSAWQSDDAMEEMVRKKGRFPENWYSEFKTSLQNDRAATRLVEEVLPICGEEHFFSLGLLAMLYAYPAKQLKLTAPKNRAGEIFAAKVRERLRELDAQIKKSSIFDPAKSLERDSLSEKLRMVPKTFQDNRTRPHDRFLWIIREYLQVKTGKPLAPRELAAIVAAAQAALGPNYNLPCEDPQTLTRRLDRFEEHSQRFCTLTKGHASIPFVEKTPHT